MTDHDAAVEVRSARADDAATVARLPALSATTRRLLATDLTAADRRVAVVAVDGTGDVVGFAMSTRQADAAHVLDVTVATEWRRRGIATRLLGELAAAADHDRTPALTLEVRSSNLAARSLYETLGFEDAGVRPGYYQDGEDAHVLWHHDPAALVVRTGVTRPR